MSEEPRLSADQRLVTTAVFRPRLSAMLAIGALGLGLLATPSGVAIAEPATPTQASTTSRQAPDSLFPEVGSSRYDVKHYAIKLSFQTSGSIEAKTTFTAKAKKPLKSFSLDLEGLIVDKVRVNGRTADFSRRDNKLIIKPSKTIAGRFSASIRYHGKPVTHIDPDGAQDGWIPTDNGAGATVLSEPVGAMTWFPNNNTPRDKAKFDMKITVPSKLEVAGSGDLKSVRKHAGKETWRWVQPHQQATYLAMISISDYNVYHSTMRTTTGRKLPIWSFIEPKLGTQEAARALIPKIIRYEERRFGPYPFNSAGIVVKDLDVDYALETQNRPVFDIDEGEVEESEIVHEFAHQWYGDSVSLTYWVDIWLNEGFATYAEWLWDASHGGPSTAERFQMAYDSHPASDPLWSPAPADFDDPADLFGNQYLRGGMTLEALRQKVGSHDFFVILRRWAQQNKYGNVTTAQFIRLSEKVSGQDLDAFFDAWLYVAKKPALS
jgi:aminopeptidase N